VRFPYRHESISLHTQTPPTQWECPDSSARLFVVAIALLTKPKSSERLRSKNSQQGRKHVLYGRGDSQTSTSYNSTCSLHTQHSYYRNALTYSDLDVLMSSIAPPGQNLPIHELHYICSQARKWRFQIVETASPFQATTCPVPLYAGGLSRSTGVEGLVK